MLSSMDDLNLAPPGTEGVEPSLWYTLLGLPFVVVGIVILALTLVSGLRQITGSLIHFVIPGGVVLQLTPDETYTVFLEKGAVVNGKTYTDWSSLGGMTCTLRSASGGPFLELPSTTANTSYSWGALSGKSVLQFKVPRAGNYEFACERVDNAESKESVIAIGGGISSAISRMNQQCLIAIFGGCGVGLVIVLIVMMQRDRSIRRIRRAGLRPV
jgi:hypothetical protein